MTRRTRGPRPAHRDRTPLQRVWDRARAADPGWDRARVSARALVAAAVGGGATIGVVGVLDGPLELSPLAAVVGLFGGISLPPAPRRTAHLARVAAAFTVSALGTAVLAPWPAAARGALLVAIAVGAWAGRWGTPGRSLGLLVFLGSFFTLLLGAGPDDASTVVVAGLLGTAGLALTERVLLPDRPAALLRRLVRSLVAQASLMVDAAEVLAAEGPGSGRQRRLRRRLLAVQEVALLVDTTLEEPAAFTSVQDAHALGSDVLTVEALADHLVWAVLSIPPDAPADHRADLTAAMRRARVPVDVDVHRRVDPLVPRLVGGGDDRIVEVVQRLAAAAERLVHAARPTVTRTAAQGACATEATDGTAIGGGGDSDTGGPVPGIMRTVVQATVAGALALALGTLLDTDQWYWAVVGAYIVVTTTASRGAGVRKAVDRLAGTALGVVAGLGVAALVADRASVGLVVLSALLFATFWVFRANYLWMMFLLTITVAVLYELTGRLTVEVLALRVAETAVGVVIAGLVVFFVLPTPTRATVDGAVDALLAALDRLLAGVGDGTVDAAAVRRVDQAVSAVRTTTTPLSTRVGRISGEIRAARLLATAVRVRVGALATALATARPSPTDLEALAVLRDHLARLRRHLDAPEPLAAAEPRPFPSSDGPIGSVLQALDDRLTGYATARGLALRPDPGALAGGTAAWSD